MPTNSLFLLLSHRFLCDPANIELKYHSAKITAARGSSAILSCVAEYDFDRCRHRLHVVWQQVDDNNTTELIDPNKYLTTVNETISDDNRRVRQVVTEILDLTPKDNGQFQCIAVCNEETARGHFIKISVTGTVLYCMGPFLLCPCGLV